MQVEIRYQPSYSFALVTLDAGETIQTESGAMVGVFARPTHCNNSRPAELPQVTGPAVCWVAKAIFFN